MKRRPNTQTIQWFLEIDAQGQLDLNPQYQRKSIWNDDYRRYFIDTILRDFPAPPVYLQVETLPGLPTIYHVIDGKQRLESILRFCKDEFHLSTYTDRLGLTTHQRYFSQLPAPMQSAFVEYLVSVENITQADQTELQNAFDRLNRNVAKLNSQELRNAQFEGAFIKKMEAVSEEPFWAKIGLSSRARVRRMLDVEFVSELYVLIMHGVQDGKGSLDDYYSLYDDEIPDQEEHDAELRQILDWLQELPMDWRMSRFRNLTDHYSLWTATIRIMRNGALPDGVQAVERLNAFQVELEAFQGDPAQDAPERVKRYYDAARQGVSKDTNRSLRGDILETLLTQ